MSGLSQNDLDWFAARLSIAVHDTNREFRALSVQDLKEKLRDIPGIENLSMFYRAGRQMFALNGYVAETDPNATVAEIESAIRTALLLPKLELMKQMPITDAGKLASDIKSRIQAAKDRIASVSSNTEAALAKLNDAANTGDQIAKQIDAEASDLLAQIGQFSNGSPE